jgi:C-terminal peptidase prc
MTRTLKLAIASLLAILLLGFTYLAPPLIPQRDAPPEGLELVEEVWQLILRDFVDREALDPDKLAQGAIRGLIEALNDPYTFTAHPAFVRISEKARALKIRLPSVKWEMLPDNIAQIRVTTFTERTGSEFASALSNIVAQGATGIVLDLRNNSGGSLDAAVKVASQFLEQGLVVYKLNNRGVRTDYPVLAGGLALDIPLAVLVNSRSLSASELVAGALQDHNRGPIIGVRTFGKGSTSRVHELSNSWVLYVTFARLFTPHGRQIEGEGIVPDIELEMTPEEIENDRDSQLKRAIEYLTLER